MIRKLLHRRVLTALIPLAFLYGMAADRLDLFPAPQVIAVARTILRPPADPTHPRARAFASFPGQADVVMLGDSAMHYTEWAEWFPEHSIVNRGVGGETTQDVARRLDEALGRRPKAVVVMAGFNDLHAGASARDVVTRLGAIGTRISAAGAVPIVMALLPAAGRHRNSTLINREIAIVNRELAAWTTANRVMLLDLAPRLAPGGELDMRYSYDGLHLNAEGYRVWRDCLAPLLNGDVVPGLQRRLRS